MSPRASTETTLDARATAPLRPGDQDHATGGLVRLSHRVVFGTLGAIEQVLAAHGWQINTAFIEVRPVGRKEACAVKTVPWNE